MILEFDLICFESLGSGVASRAFFVSLLMTWIKCMVSNHIIGCVFCFFSWNSVMYSHSFLEMYRRVPSPEPCFLMFEAKDRSMCSVYNPTSNRWHRIPFTFFHYETKFPCAAAGGLLCFCGVSAYPSLSVCNPLTRRYESTHYSACLLWIMSS